jgi:hypothetical protein
VNYELKTVPQQQHSLYHPPQSSSSNSNSNSNNNSILQEARELASKVGLSIESDLRNINIVTTATTTTSTTTTASSIGTTNTTSTATTNNNTNTNATGSSSHSHVLPISTTTGGYSNTDHIITRIGGDDRTDRIYEYRRQYMIRQRTVTNNETKLYTQKWDKHRVVGERRRRIIRDIDLPNAPTEPPPSGYIIFLGQMTTKLRYDAYKRDTTKRIKHDQTKMVQEISNMWKASLDDTDREYYHHFYIELKKEYQQQLMEYRATGYYTPSTKYIRNHTNVGLWTHIHPADKNALEMEIATYETIQFPSSHLDDEEQLRRIQISKEKRKLKIQQQREEMLQKHPPQQQSTDMGLSIILQRKRRRRRSSNGSSIPATTTITTSTAPTKENSTPTTVTNDNAESMD